MVPSRSNTMRLLAYFHPEQDPYALRASLRAAGWTSVGMRDASLWRPGDIESGWAAVHAPLYPGIAREYAAHGIQIAEVAVGGSLPPAPHEVDALPLADVYAVVNPGRFLMNGIDAFPIPPGAQIIGVNEAARRVECHWQLCNDGFTDAKFQGVMGSPGRISRKQFAATIGTGQWYALERVGIHDGNFSTTCALLCAAAHASTVLLYGHDLTPGTGLDSMTCSWPGSQLSSCAAEVQAEIERIAASGKRVIHYKKQGKKIIAQEYGHDSP